jgi:hypothetical protein
MQTSYIVASGGSTAIGDIDNDGLVEIVIPSSNRLLLYVFEHDGTLKWSAPTGPRYTGGGGTRDAVTLADIDHDGDVEIIHGRRSFDHLGVQLWEGAGDDGGDINYGFLTIVADLDLTGDMEIIAGRTAYNSYGQIIWNRTDITNSGGFTAVGNFDEDYYPEVVLVAGGRVYLLEHTGQTKWGPISLPGGGIGGAPTISDVDGDGQPEIGVAGASRYVVFETDGSIKWTTPTQDLSSSRTGSTVFDFNGDGKSEVIYADELNLYVYEGTTGTVLLKKRIGSGTTLEYPVLVDIDNDNHAEIIITSNNSKYSTRRGVFALEGINDDWVPTRSIWNQHSYHITNVNDDGSIPRDEVHSWQTHNTYRLNAFPDRSATSVPDLSVALLRVVDNGNGQTVSLTARIGNAGAAPSPANVQTAFYQGDPSSGGVLLGTLTLMPLEVGEYRDIQLTGVTGITGTDDIHVVVDAADIAAECNESNNSMSIPIPVSTLGSIDVSTDAADYGPDSPVLLQAFAANAGSFTGSFTGQLRIKDAAGNLVVEFAAHDLGLLAAGASANFTEDWNTALYLAGSYQLHGTLRGTDGAVVSEAVSLFRIKHPDDAGPEVTLRTTTDKPAYHTTDSVRIQDLVQNLTSNVLIESALLRVTVMDPGGQVVFTDEITLGQVVPGSLRDHGSLYSFSDGQHGLYNVLGVVIDTQSNDVLASDQTTFTVQQDLSVAVSGQVTAEFATLEAGENQVCTDVISNTGDLPIEGLQLRRILARIDTAAEIELGTAIIDLPLDPPTTLLRTQATAGLEAGDYACVLQAYINDDWQSLDYANFTIMVPPIKIDATLTQSGRGRLLVLLDAALANGGVDSCTGMRSIDLSLPFNPALDPAATAVIELRDSQNTLIDSEAVDLTTVNGPVNAHAGTGGVDLRVSEFTATHARLQLDGNASTSGALGASYHVVTTLTDGANVLTLQSTSINTGCTEPVFIGDILGGYQIAALDLAGAANDPHGSQDAPALWYQRAFLEALLDNAGWSYTLVTSADDFARELRSGGYSTYALLSEQEHLAEQFQKELREAVWLGEGLLVAGGHDERNGRVEAALGVKIIGKHASATGNTLSPSALNTGGSADFAFGEHALRIQLDGATAVGTFNFDGNAAADNTALTTYDYGAGRSVLAGFDLLAHATAYGSGTVYADLILSALEHVSPTVLSQTPGAVIPLTVNLTNQGIATPGRVILAAPAGSAFVDAGDGVLQTDGSAHWAFDLAESATDSLTVWLRLPETPGAITVTASVQTGSEPDWLDHVEATLDVTVTAAATLGSAQTAIAPLAADKSRNKLYASAKQSLDRAATRLTAGDHPDALKELLKATDDLLAIDEPEARAIRTTVDGVIHSVERLL